MLSRVQAPSRQEPSSPCTGAAVTFRVLPSRRRPMAAGCPPVACSRACRSSVEVTFSPLQLTIRSPSRMPQSRAGQGSVSEVDTTSTPSAKSLMPTAFPTGIKVR